MKLNVQPEARVPLETGGSGSVGLAASAPVRPKLTVQEETTSRLGAAPDGRVPLRTDTVRLVSVENDYNALVNKPKLEGVTLMGNVTLGDIGAEAEHPEISELEIRRILRKVRG